jgi:hypothetical protein
MSTTEHLTALHSKIQLKRLPNNVIGTIGAALNLEKKLNFDSKKGHLRTEHEIKTTNA